MSSFATRPIDRARAGAHRLDDDLGLRTDGGEDVAGIRADCCRLHGLLLEMFPGEAVFKMSYMTRTNALLDTFVAHVEGPSTSRDRP